MEIWLFMLLYEKRVMMGILFLEIDVIISVELRFVVMVLLKIMHDILKSVINE